jgi:hypothetical protein
MYKLLNTGYDEIVIKLNEDGSMSSFIKDEANADYQAYLAWVAEGNTAEEYQPE